MQVKLSRQRTLAPELRQSVSGPHFMAPVVYATPGDLLFS
jgi:hypothetical protein